MILCEVNNLIILINDNMAISSKRHGQKMK